MRTDSWTSTDEGVGYGESGKDLSICAYLKIRGLLLESFLGIILPLGKTKLNLLVDNMD